MPWIGENAAAVSGSISYATSVSDLVHAYSSARWPQFIPWNEPIGAMSDRQER